MRGMMSDIIRPRIRSAFSCGCAGAKRFWGDTAGRSVSRGANPGTDSQFPANCAGNLVSVPGLRRIARGIAFSWRSDAALRWSLPLEDLMTRICSRVALAAVFIAAFVSAQPGAPIPQQLVFTPYHASGIYDVGEMVGWTVTPGPVESTYSYKWTIRRNNAVVLKEGTLDLSSGKDKIETTGDEPEMLYVAIEPVAKPVTDDAAATPEASVATSAGRGRGNPGEFVGGNTGRNNGGDAPRRLRLVLGRQTRRAGQGSHEPGADSCPDRGPGRRDECVRDRRTGI